MSFTHDSDFTVNIYGSAQPVKRKSFTVPSVGIDKDDLEAGFSDPRVYLSPTDVSEDVDLKAAAKAEVAGLFNQNPRPPKVQVHSMDFTDVASINGALDAALAYSDEWFAHTTNHRTKANLLTMAAWSMTNQRLLGIQSSDADIIAGTAANLFDTIQGLANPWTFGCWHDTDAEPNATAYMAAGLWPDPDQKHSGWYHKPLIGISVPNLTPTQGQNILDDGGNVYAPVKSVGAMNPGKTFADEWIDSLITREWFKARLQEDIAQFQLDLSKRGEVVPFTSVGMGMLAGRCYKVGGRGERIGHFQPGSVRVVVPEIEEVSDQEIVDRHATLAVEALESGGIKKVTLNVGVLAVEP